MSKFLRRNREDLKTKIYQKLSLSQEYEEERESSTPSLQLDKALRETEKRKLGIRKLIHNNSNSSHLDFSDEMGQLKWRIDALRSFSQDKGHGINNPNRTSLTGHDDPSINKHLTFDELYERQKNKFATLKERRKTKTTDPKYIEMIGNLQQRKEKRKNLTKSKVDQQMKILNDHLEDATGLD